jgi:DNA-binding MarR family transcriptional regulator
VAPKTRWLTEEENKAWKGLTLMQFQLFALLGRELADTGLSFQDYVVLAELSDRPDNRARLNELGRQLGWEKSRISHQVSRMEQRGLVEKVRCDTDQRGWFIGMTAEGHAAISSAAPHHVATVRRCFVDLLTAQELRVLESITSKVLAELPEP